MIIDLAPLYNHRVETISSSTQETGSYEDWIMTHGTLKFDQTQTGDRWKVMRRAEELRSEETRRLTSALLRRLRDAFAVVTGRRRAIERVFIPRRTYHPAQDVSGL